MESRWLRPILEMSVILLLCFCTNVQTRKQTTKQTIAPHPHSHIHFHLSVSQGTVERARPREIFCPMPVMLVRAVAADKADGQVGGGGHVCLCVCVFVFLYMCNTHRHFLFTFTHTYTHTLHPPPHTQAYQCPVYRTEQRGPTYIFTAQLKTKSPPARWVMAGAGLVMDVAS
jgi:hypothetical protein